jgi:hypothetical protein
VTRFCSLDLKFILSEVTLGLGTRTKLVCAGALVLSALHCTALLQTLIFCSSGNYKGNGSPTAAARFSLWPLVPSTRMWPSLRILTSTSNESTFLTDTHTWWPLLFFFWIGNKRFPYSSCTVFWPWLYPCIGQLDLFNFKSYHIGYLDICIEY